MSIIERKDLDISKVSDERIKELNKSIEKGNQPAGKLSPLVGRCTVSIQMKIVYGKIKVQRFAT